MPRRCCCVPTTADCILGDDDFVRANSTDTPGPLWKLVSGTCEIVTGHIEVNGVVATRICHPIGHDHGSYKALVTLTNCRTVSFFEIGCGDPTAIPYFVQFSFSGMDTGAAKITVTVIGTSTVTEDFPWPADGLGSVNSVDVTICYEPGALLRGSLNIPAVDTCIPGPGARCYTSGADDVGGFSFTHGHFTNWLYIETILDNYDCEPCGCFCFRRSGVDKEFSCYPSTLTLHLGASTGSCPELIPQSITLYQSNLAPHDGYVEKIRWASEVLECDGNEYAFVAECAIIAKSGTDWLYALDLKIKNGSYTDSTVLFQWAEPGVNGATRSPDFARSTCEPLSLVYPRMKVNSFFGPCGYPPGSFGYFIFCCPSAGCNATPIVMEFEAIITI